MIGIERLPGQVRLLDPVNFISNFRYSKFILHGEQGYRVDFGVVETSVRLPSGRVPLLRGTGLAVPNFKRI